MSVDHERPQLVRGRSIEESVQSDNAQSLSHRSAGVVPAINIPENLLQENTDLEEQKLEEKKDTDR